MEFQEEHDVNTAESSSQALCRECGLCCDGTVYAFAYIKPDEDVMQLKKIGITTINDDGKSFTLPCKSFDQICTIYHTGRARVCGEYLCKLVIRHNSGEISYDGALAIIRKTKAHKEKTQASFLAACGVDEGSLNLQYQILLQSQAESKTRMHDEAKLNFVALQLQLDRHFRTCKK